MNCVKCGAELVSGSRFCGLCGTSQVVPGGGATAPGPGPMAGPAGLAPRQYGPGPYAARPVEGDKTGGIIPYKNPYALGAYYCGIFAVIPLFGLVLGTVGLVLGIMGLKEANKNPVIKGKVHAWVGIIVGGGCAVLNLLLVASMFIPIFVR